MIENGQCHFYKIMLQSTSIISNTCYLKLSLSQTFSSFPSAPSAAALISSFDISNSAISSFHYVKLFSWSLQGFLGQFSNVKSLDEENIFGFLIFFFFKYFLKENKNVLYFSLLFPLNYLHLASQCTKYSISFTAILNLWKTKILDVFAISNIHFPELFHRSHWGSR